ncbi:MAG TPA: fibronectin type III domain-containing protein, partial [Chitinophagaceae bacterium]|nr:fibronectin type III domain-containing protein [Chitinophagaceae bacterium]
FFTLLVFCAFVFTTKAQLLTENFSYTVGQAITANGWTAHSAAGTNAITVTAPGLSYTGHPGSGVGNAVTMTTSGEDDNRTFTSTNSGSVYFSFLVNLSAVQGGDYFIGVLQNTSIFPVRVYAKTDGAGGFYFGASKGNSTAAYETNVRSLNTTYLVVAKYTYNTGTTTDDVVDLWVNPALGGTETTATIPNITGTSLDATSISAIYLRQGSAASAATPQVDAILVGTTWADVTPSGATPSLSISSPLSSFGNVCINTTAGPNSFTISGSNLTNANVNVAALSGYEYATATGGPYTNTLSITQAGGTFTQQVYVRFKPTAVQSYNGNIAVSGGGVSTPVNAAAVGSGVNSAPTVTTGAASAITQTTATAAGSIPDIGCSAITAYGIEYSTTNGFPNGTGTQVAASNLSSGNFSSNLTGLTAGTTYYYKAYATNGGGTGYGTQQQFTTQSLSPALSATTLSGFGNVCINTVAGPNSFTINGTNLTTANVTVGPLSGFTFSTTSGGTYTASLNLTQAGGTFTQQVFVRFNPIAVQSYSGDIPVSGGGATSINVTATGAGVNSTPTVVTGAASSITQTTATAAGTISGAGCSAVTAYGIEYSTTNNFTPGTGTQVTSGNLSAGNFSSNLTGLTPSTTYYYRAYATNGGGTGYGSQLSFTTAAPTLSATALSGFGNVCINTTTAANSFTITGVGLTNANVNVGPLAGYSFATTSGGTYSASLSLTQPGGAYSQTIYVKFSPTAVQAYNGNIAVSGGGASTTQVAASGSGVNTMATVVTGGSSNITTQSAVLAGSISDNGCSAVTVYGIEFSGINGFADGTGTQVVSGNISGGNFNVTLNGLVQGATYYYKAFATNNGGTSYGTQQSFTVLSVANSFAVYPSPADKGGNIRVTKNNVQPGYYGVLFFNSSGQLVYQYNINVQSNYINQLITLPGSMSSGNYRVSLVNNEKVLETKTIQVF